MRTGLRSGMRSVLRTGFSPSDGHGPPNQLLAMFGQSNQLGHMASASVTVYPGLSSSYAGVQLVDHNAGAFVDPPVYHDEGPRNLAPRTAAYNGYLVGDGGVELVIGRELDARTVNNWYVAKMAIDGSSLLTGWNLSTYPTTPPSLLNQAITFVQAQAAVFNVTDLANNLVVMWNQGEADTGTTYALYRSNLLAFIASLRASLGNFRWLCHRLSCRNDLTGNVRAAQESVVGSDSRSAISYADDLALRDAAHYTDDNYATLGVREANILINNLLPGVAQTSPYWVAGGPFTISDSSSSVTPTLPDHQENDIIVVVLSALGNTVYPLSPANSFVEMTNSPQHDSASTLNARLHVWWVRATSGATSAPTISDVASDDFKMGQAFVIRGCKTSGNPFDITAGATAATSTSVSWPTVTTTQANCLVVNVLANRIDLTTPQIDAAEVNASLTDLTRHVNKNTNSGGGYGINICAGRKAVAGAVSATTATLATTSTQAMMTISFTAV